MTYTLPESTKLIEKGVLNLDLEDITKILDGFFKPSETSSQLTDVQPSLDEKIDLELLASLTEQESTVTRMLNAIRKFAPIIPYDETPSEKCALDLYNSAIKKAASGLIAHPWEYQRSFGEKSFKLLEDYLSAKGTVTEQYKTISSLVGSCT
ncbi:MAG: hypothetical protein Q8R04_04930 [Nanoarchaeota archaeon]|nr:hypothetical protein [Nanoarchaeota archaeon]